MRILQTKGQRKMKPQPFVTRPIKPIISGGNLFRLSVPNLEALIQGVKVEMMKVGGSADAIFKPIMCPHQGKCKIH